jgi:hypothetical protein
MCRRQRQGLVRQVDAHAQGLETSNIRQIFQIQKLHVVEKGMDGIFYYMAKEEAAIRSNPAKRTTELLKQVFGAN